jgi:hypothetical protein
MTCRQELLPLMLALSVPVPFDPALPQDRSTSGQVVDEPVKRVDS